MTTPQQPTLNDREFNQLVHKHLEDFKNNPSNANKYFYSLLAEIDTRIEEALKTREDEIEKTEKKVLKEFLWSLDCELQNYQAIKDAVKEIILKQRMLLHSSQGNND